MIQDNFRRIGIIGGGAWGTALAQTLARTGCEVMIWTHEASTASEINNHHTNEFFLAGISLNRNIKATLSLELLAENDLLLMTSPSQHIRSIASKILPYINNSTPLLICAKGIEQSSGKLLTEVLTEELPDITFGVLSGPSFACEVARGLPAALTLASQQENLNTRFARTLGSKCFRIYWTDDMIGVQLGGAIKNVLAIAAGMVEGKELGANAHAAIVTRGFAEMCRFAKKLGARTETLSGLSGLGDLLLTCSSSHSRNMTLGRALGQGHSIEKILGARKTVTEGIYTAQAIVKIAQKKEINVPISSAVNAIIGGKTTVNEAIDGLMKRALRAERDSFATELSVLDKPSLMSPNNG
ncbi:MAG: NAD(P)-dependent glycerol-3-phosphate dehydrogenase [Hyphomicrobiaceae bacterium]|nr:NAD(P)-dependent glycerol-3-phosphate dehydrogenase [Hyphomicrobiaceae bacterium]